MTVEIVAQSAEDAVRAQRAGATRIELVSALPLGGLTPSIGLLEETRSRCGLPIVTMLRPRTGGFAYTEDELAAMVRDAKYLRADGLVFGVLDPHARIDEAANARLVELTEQAVFHRAFDALDDPFEGLETLVRLGFRRVLTSGGRATALEGAETIRRLREQADGRIEVLAGVGIRAANVVELVARTGVDQVHLAALAWTDDPSGGRMAFNGAAHPEDRYGRVDEATVAAVVAATRPIRG